MAIKETIEIKSDADLTAEKVAKQRAKVKAEKPRGVVNVDALNVRFKPDPKSDVLTIVKKGQQFTLQKSGVEGWIHVFSDGGIDGYCAEQYITKL